MTARIAVVGAGPAGLAAAGEVRAAGAPVLLIEERPQLGGRAMIVPGARGLTEGLMRALGGAEVWRGSPVWALCGRTLSVLRSGRDETVAADAVILATGAPDVLRPFPGSELDGVLTLEAGWEAVRSGRLTPDAGPVIAAGSAAATLAVRLHERGVPVAMVAADRPPGLVEAIPHISGALAAARGPGAVEEVELADGARHACRTLCVESPRVPLVDLARLAGCPWVYQPLLGGWIPRYDPLLMLHGPTPRLFVAGDAAGLDTPRAAAELGRLAARAALAALGLLPDAAEQIADSRRRLAAASAPLHARAREALMAGVQPDEVSDRWDGPPETVVCPCEGVTVAALREAWDGGAHTADDLGRLTGCGTGTCGWRRCGAPVLWWLSGALDTATGRLPLPAALPPARPVPVSALAGVPAAPDG